MSWVDISISPLSTIVPIAGARRDQDRSLLLLALYEQNSTNRHRNHRGRRLLRMTILSGFKVFEANLSQQRSLKLCRFCYQRAMGAGL